MGPETSCKSVLYPLRMKQIRLSSLEKFLLTCVRTVGLPAHR